MTEANSNKRIDQAIDRSQCGGRPRDNNASQEERPATRGMEDWEMVEQMYEPESGLKTLGLSFIGSFILGILAFALLAFSLYYFLFNYGDLFFTPHSK